MIPHTLPIVHKGLNVYVSEDWIVKALRKYSPKLSAKEMREIGTSYVAGSIITGIPSLMAFTQGSKETNWFTDRHWKEQFNSAGIGITSSIERGNVFPDPMTGILVQYMHLVNYAVDPRSHSVTMQKLTKLDPRLRALEMQGWLGTAVLWINLDGKWAYPGRGYGASIIERANVLLEVL